MENIIQMLADLYKYYLHWKFLISVFVFLPNTQSFFKKFL